MVLYQDPATVRSGSFRHILIAAVRNPSSASSISLHDLRDNDFKLFTVKIDSSQRVQSPFSRKNTVCSPATQRDAVTSDDSATESEDLNTATLVKELIKLRREIRRRDELQKEELQKVKEEFSAALAEVRHEL
jgi:hypothetical protein